ncbi:hypothetical protein N7445_008320 [Penicillium cf. griseofulvum]|nr:hypothetical protein N7445_008320 [Penicillium cf. griseofulvum]
MKCFDAFSSFDSNGTTDITPERLATFYRKVGGNYDPLFLETKAQALSFIYQSLGCFHSLQPSANPYEPPSIPSLLPNGFVRWQTIQLLMDPDEHSVYLQNAVNLWDIAGVNGEPFPKTIPRDAFPSEPDPEMLEWHEGTLGRIITILVVRILYPMKMITSPVHAGRRQSVTVMRRQIDVRSLDITADTIAENFPTLLHASLYQIDRVSQPPEFHPLPPWGERERPHRPSGRDQATPDVSDVSSDESARHRRDRAKPNRQERRHLSPPSSGNARRHSHEAYTRRPFRDLSPTSPTRQRRGHESHSSRFSKSEPSPNIRPREHPRDDRDHPRDYPKENPKDRSRTRTAGVKFHEFIFGDTAPAPAAPEPPFYRSSTPPPPRAVPRHLGSYAADDMRRGSYSGGSTGNSRPSSGGSGSERQRSYSSAGFHPRSTGWASPRNSAKRYPPATVPEDDGYVPSRRVPIYE